MSEYRLDVRYDRSFVGDMDEEVESIVGQRSASSGFFTATGERDLQFYLPRSIVNTVAGRLKGHGYSVDIREDDREPRDE